MALEKAFYRESPETLARIDAVAKALSLGRRGPEFTRSDILREAVAAYLPIVEASPVTSFETLSASFPALRGLDGTAPFDANTLAASAKGSAPSTTISAAFVLALWSGTVRTPPKRVQELAARWSTFEIARADAPTRAAFAAWLRNPWIPAGAR